MMTLYLFLVAFILPVSKLTQFLYFFFVFLPFYKVPEEAREWAWTSQCTRSRWGL